MKKAKYYILSLLCMIFVLGAVNVNASEKTDALRAYGRMLSTGNLVGVPSRIRTSIRPSTCQFKVIYLDNNNVPELLVYLPAFSHADGRLVLYTYSGRQVRRVTNFTGDRLSTLGYYPKKGIFMDNYSGMGMSYYRYLKFGSGYVYDTGIYKYQKAVNNSYWGSNTYGINKNKVVSKTTFHNALVKYKGTAQFTKLTFHQNTSANRSRYLGY